MTLQASGTIWMSQINSEFGGRGNNLNSYRGTVWYTDAGGSGTFSAGQIAFSEFFSKRVSSPTFNFTIGSHQANANLRTLAVNAGWNQSSAVVATIAGGVHVSATSTGSPALTINGSFPGGVHLINNGYIVGMGGNGGYGASSWYGRDGGWGAAGGTALSVGTGVTITNNGIIAGGGGGGGGGSAGWYNYGKIAIEGGGGGGGGGRATLSANSSGGSGGPASYANNGSPGGAGTVNGPGAGGAYGSGIDYRYAGNGGNGGDWGASGAWGQQSVGAGNAGGPGSGGYAISGNGWIGWAATGTRYGAIG